MRKEEGGKRNIDRYFKRSGRCLGGKERKGREETWE
jgi:hypothetical protein